MNKPGEDFKKYSETFRPMLLLFLQKHVLLMDDAKVDELVAAAWWAGACSNVTNRPAAEICR